MREHLIPKFISTLINNRQSVLIKWITAIGIFFVIYYISTIIVKKVKYKIENNSLESDTYTNNMAKVSGNMVWVFLLVFNILAVFQIIGFDTALIMWWISLSLGFAMENIIENTIAGIMFLTNKRIKIGDFVEFRGKINMKWTVEETNLRYTTIRAWDRRRTIVPNSIMAKTPIKTYKTEPLIKGDLSFRLPRHVNVEQVKNILNTTINEHKRISYKEYTHTIITNFDARGIVFKCFWYADPHKKSPYMMARELRPKIYEAFTKYGIKLGQNKRMVINTPWRGKETYIS